LKDFHGVVGKCKKEIVFLFHDVINYKMEKSFDQIKSLLPHYNSLILWRTTSGKGVLIPKAMDKSLEIAFLYFSENETYTNTIISESTKRPTFKSFIARFLPKALKKIIRKLIY